MNQEEEVMNELKGRHQRYKLLHLNSRTIKKTKRSNHYKKAKNLLAKQIKEQVNYLIGL